MNTLIEIAMKKEGYTSYYDMIENALTNSLCLAICTECMATDFYEQDCRDGHCYSCGENTMQSILVLEGMI
jgi:hypothetical protein